MSKTLWKLELPLLTPDNRHNYELKHTAFRAWLLAHGVGSFTVSGSTTVYGPLRSDEKQVRAYYLGCERGTLEDALRQAAILFPEVHEFKVARLGITEMVHRDDILSTVLTTLL